MSVGQTVLIFMYVLCLTFFLLLLQFGHILSDFLFMLYPTDDKFVFDYIIVGGGSAGSLIATNLAHNGINRVLVLEAGKTNIDLLHIPSVGLLLQKTPFDWQYKTLSQQNSCLALNQNISLWPMGKILGGTSMLNNMLYVRGHEEDFNEWFRGKENYRYSDVLTLFKKLENFKSWQNKEIRDSEKPIYISDLVYSTIFPSIMLKVAKSLGFPILHTNLNSRIGFSIPKANLYKGKRWTSADKLKLHSNSNLVVKTNCLVEKILFKSNFEAYGVKYISLGKKYIATARKAVILSAGVIGTPKLLMLSGIGKKDHLEEMEINPIIDLSVGDNLQDHLATGFGLVMLNQSLDIGINSMLSPTSILDYFLNGSGPWTTTGCELMAFFQTKNGSFENSSRPNLQIMFMPLGITEDKGYYLRKLMGFSDRVWLNYFSKIPKESMSILPVLLHPKSRGTVRLASKNPSVPPLIDPRYLTHPEDADVLISGIELIKTLIHTKEFKAFGAEFNTNIFPGCDKHIFGTKHYWECYIRQITITTYHPVGTCKMGRYDDPSSVVDFNFQVKGTNKLYVVDGSVIPTLPSGNINAPILMLAAMASDIISEAYYLSLKQCRVNEIFIPETMC